jgi:methylmalonyl-CoA mutase N-terminal domain/subunit
MPPIIKAAKTYATLGEIVEAMKDIFGEWQESSIF